MIGPSCQPSWMAKVVVGSVIRRGHRGMMRVVREVNRSPSGSLKYVTLSIQRCSWTGRAYTVISANDLKQRGFQLVPVRPVVLKGEWNERMRRAIEQPAKERPFAMKCCEAVGVP